MGDHSARKRAGTSGHGSSSQALGRQSEQADPGGNDAILDEGREGMDRQHQGQSTAVWALEGRVGASSIVTKTIANIRAVRTRGRHGRTTNTDQGLAGSPNARRGDFPSRNESSKHTARPIVICSSVLGVELTCAPAFFNAWTSSAEHPFICQNRNLESRISSFSNSRTTLSRAPSCMLELKCEVIVLTLASPTFLNTILRTSAGRKNRSNANPKQNTERIPDVTVAAIPIFACSGEYVRWAWSTTVVVPAARASCIPAS
ncbi:uncharacterized protein BDR25DRAFT_368560 [Lindgomyces ingoldianus]|uniref:Uncharacterized protein n=1 Tax=Lindgomyces ingoldianus TaxID=673940 RepID=A0ACB6QV47_9PLEO|nr:uncharacterized protein BDR25DRAFT_368560 [Lindgomyces ingoldianus]KAF2470889.1 hypothetical protein BDR25DRAFT_368560 [Lindgomyces ingoldianus]